MLKVAIIDDEEHVREALTNMLKLYLNSLEWVESFSTVDSAVNFIKHHKIDVLLLDINVGKENGFSIFKHFPTPDFKVIFVTAYQQYAIEAFRFSAIDYLLKPVDPDKLVEAVGRANDLIDKEKMFLKIDSLLHNLNIQQKTKKKMVLKTSDSIHVVNPEEIMYCEADGSYTRFHLADGSRIMVTKTLGAYEEVLETGNFLRIHQTYLLNLDYLKRFDKAEGGRVILKDGTSLPVASRKKEQLLQWISK